MFIKSTSHVCGTSIKCLKVVVILNFTLATVRFKETYNCLPVEISAAVWPHMTIPVLSMTCPFSCSGAPFVSVSVSFFWGK